MRKRKALKGGYINGQAASSGPTLKEQLRKINEDELDKIKKTYDGLYEKSKQEVELTLAIKKAREQEYNNAQTKELNKFARIEKSLIENKKLAFKAVSGFLGFITKFIGSVINFFRQFTAYAIKQLFHGGQGVFLKAFMAIVVIIGVFVGFTYGIDLFNNDTALSSYNDIRQNIINTDYDKYLTMPNSDTYMAKMQDKMSSMIPNSFKYKWSSFYNSASHMVTGKNKYDSYLKERQEIDTGRCDDIFHINFINTTNDYQMERTYSIIAPKNVILKYNDNLYNDSDYNRIDSNIKELVQKYHSTCIIPIKPNENTGKYELKLNSNVYYTYNNLLLNPIQSNLIKPIFDNDLKFASFNNISYTGYYDSGNIIGAYATKLINPNYKGPILRLTTAHEIRNENNKNQKTANFYNVYNTNDLYCIILDKKISYKDFFATKSSSTIYVAAIYDQSGNNHNFIFKDNDNKYMPEYIHDNKIIKFYNRRILFLSKPIVSKFIKINAKMSVVNTEILLDDKNIINAKKDIDEFNANKNFITNLDNKFKNNYKYYIRSRYSISNFDDIMRDYSFIMSIKKRIATGDELAIRYKNLPITNPENPDSNDSNNIVFIVDNYETLKKIKSISEKSEYNFINENLDIDKTAFDNKMKELTTIVDNLNYNYVDTYMSFLATNTEAIAKIQFKENKKEKLYFQYKDDTNQISDNYNLTDNKIKLSNIEFNFKSDNDITIETLGNILDSRSQNDKNRDTNGDILAHLTNKHSFRGYISELRIFRNA
jgi:hypothetical protein